MYFGLALPLTKGSVGSVACPVPTTNPSAARHHWGHAGVRLGAPRAANSASCPQLPDKHRTGLRPDRDGRKWLAGSIVFYYLSATLPGCARPVARGGVLPGDGGRFRRFLRCNDGLRFGGRLV